MFVTTQLNALNNILTEKECSETVINRLDQYFVNIEATLLRAKVLRDFSKQKNHAIIQTTITENDMSLAYLFSVFVLANLNKTTIYMTPLTAQIQHILQPFYQVEKTLNLKQETVLESLNLFLDFSNDGFNDVDFIYLQLIKALTNAEVSTVFLITDQSVQLKNIIEIEHFLNVQILIIQTKKQDLDIQQLKMQKLLFKSKDDLHHSLSNQFAEINAQLLYLSGLYQLKDAKNLIEDMFYSEHIYEKLSVYAEFMQTKIQNDAQTLKLLFTLSA
ncbi:hypothetical protein ACG94X_03985 [Acinetobacter sp. ULE_I010]|uniref:hypothetical protein n=1 Tax=Acinetobacter sp. ULE_I010 TaxID=3373065 RepID=UPI003AF87596